MQAKEQELLGYDPVAQNKIKEAIKQNNLDQLKSVPQNSFVHNTFATIFDITLNVPEALANYMIESFCVELNKNKEDAEDIALSSKFNSIFFLQHMYEKEIKKHKDTDPNRKIYPLIDVLENVRKNLDRDIWNSLLSRRDYQLLKEISNDFPSFAISYLQGMPKGTVHCQNDFLIRILIGSGYTNNASVKMVQDVMNMDPDYDWAELISRTPLTVADPDLFTHLVTLCPQDMWRNMIKRTFSPIENRYCKNILPNIRQVVETLNDRAGGEDLGFFDSDVTIKIMLLLSPDSEAEVNQARFFLAHMSEDRFLQICTISDYKSPQLRSLLFKASDEKSLPKMLANGLVYMRQEVCKLPEDVDLSNVITIGTHIDGGMNNDKSIGSFKKLAEIIWNAACSKDVKLPLAYINIAILEITSRTQREDKYTILQDIYYSIIACLAHRDASYQIFENLNCSMEKINFDFFEDWINEVTFASDEHMQNFLDNCHKGLKNLTDNCKIRFSTAEEQQEFCRKIDEECCLPSDKKKLYLESGYIPPKIDLIDFVNSTPPNTLASYILVIVSAFIIQEKQALAQKHLEMACEKISNHNYDEREVAEVLGRHFQGLIYNKRINAGVKLVVLDLIQEILTANALNFFIQEIKFNGLSALNDCCASVILWADKQAKLNEETKEHLIETKVKIVSQTLKQGPKKLAELPKEFLIYKVFTFTYKNIKEFQVEDLDYVFTSCCKLLQEKVVSVEDFYNYSEISQFLVSKEFIYHERLPKILELCRNNISTDIWAQLISINDYAILSNAHLIPESMFKHIVIDLPEEIKQQATNSTGGIKLLNNIAKDTYSTSYNTMGFLLQWVDSDKLAPVIKDIRDSYYELYKFILSLKHVTEEKRSQYINHMVDNFTEDALIKICCNAKDTGKDLLLTNGVKSHSEFMTKGLAYNYYRILNVAEDFDLKGIVTIGTKINGGKNLEQAISTSQQLTSAMKKSVFSHSFITNKTYLFVASSALLDYANKASKNTQSSDELSQRKDIEQKHNFHIVIAYMGYDINMVGYDNVITILKSFRPGQPEELFSEKFKNTPEGQNFLRHWHIGMQTFVEEVDAKGSGKDKKCVEEMMPIWLGHCGIVRTPGTIPKLSTLSMQAFSRCMNELASPEKNLSIQEKNFQGMAKVACEYTRDMPLDILYSVRCSQVLQNACLGSTNTLLIDLLEGQESFNEYNLLKDLWRRTKDKGEDFVKNSFFYLLAGAAVEKDDDFARELFTPNCGQADMLRQKLFRLQKDTNNQIYDKIVNFSLETVGNLKIQYLVKENHGLAATFAGLEDDLKKMQNKPKGSEVVVEEISSGITEMSKEDKERA